MIMFNDDLTTINTDSDSDKTRHSSLLHIGIDIGDRADDGTDAKLRCVFYAYIWHCYLQWLLLAVVFLLYL